MTTQTAAHMVKMRERGKRAWWFATPEGEGTRLRIHASRFATADSAQAFIDQNAEFDHIEFKVVSATPRPRKITGREALRVGNVDGKEF